MTDVTIERPKSRIELTPEQLFNKLEVKRVREHWQMMCASAAKPTGLDHLEYCVVRSILARDGYDAAKTFDYAIQAFGPVSNDTKLANGRYEYDTLYNTAASLLFRMKNNGLNTFNISSENLELLQVALIEIVYEI